MRVRIELSMLLSAAVLALSACGADEKPAMSLEEYAKRDCAQAIDGIRRTDALGQELMNRASQPSALADTVSAMAQTFRDDAAKVEELGDPPNREGKGGSKAGAEMMRSTGQQLEQLANNIRSAKTTDEILVLMNKLQLTVSQGGAEFKAKYPTPELDKLEKQIPDCPVVG